VENWKGVDIDGDGYGVFEGDCWDSLEGPPGSSLSGADIGPDATETWYDGIDQNCDGVDDFDPDGDGWVKDEAHLNQPTLGLPDSGTGHIGAGDCYNTPEDIDGSIVDAPFVVDDSVEAVDITSVDPASVHPDAMDTWYDGIDQNCDDADDYDADADGDRSLADGDGLDCADDDPIRSGIFDEVCDPDGVDEDCDDLVNGADDSVDPETAFEAFDDSDGDTYGDPDTTQVVCDLPTGMVANSDDCNDTDEAISPDADEICDDADVDEDCDGAADDADSSVVYASSDEAWTDGDGDGYGDPDARVEVCDPIEGLSTNAQDCDDTNEDVNPAATEVCNDIDDDCANGIDDDDPAVDLSTGTEFYRDSDDDGYGDPSTDNATTACDLPDGYTTAADATDCDDTNRDVNPDATEICNDIDDDCANGADDADPNVSYGRGDVWYEDDDGDSYGNLSSPTSSCDQPADYVRDDSDCDDTERTINPGADEVCDNDDVDENCAGGADDDDPSVTGPFTTFYADSDRDSFGDPDTSVEQCDAPANYVTDNTDCDDSDGDINTDADEICDAADTDEDCNSLADDDDPGVDSATYDTFYRDSDTDTYGDPDTTIGACDEPTGYVDNSDDCDDGDINVNPAAQEICNGGIDDDCVNGADDDDPSVDTSGFSTFYIDGDEDDYGVDTTTTTACAVPDGYAEVDGDCDDGESSTFPGAPETCNDGVDSDCEPATCMLESDALEDGADVIWRGEDVNDAFGFRVLMTADITGDGNPDAVVSAFYERSDSDGTAKAVGGVVRIGPSLASVDLDDGTDTVPAAAATLNGEDGYDRMGTGLASGDFDGDGTPDIITGATTAEITTGLGLNSKGVAYLWSGPLSGNLSVATDSDAQAEGAAAQHNLGWASAAGDINGDSYADLAIAAPQCSESSLGTQTSDNGAGLVYVLPGGSSTSWFDISLAATTGIEFSGGTTGDCAGHAIVFADIDGSGTDTLVVGAPNAGTGGEIYISDTSQTGAQALSDEVTMDGWSSNHGIGTALVAEDFNNDGYIDLVVGAPGVAVYNGAVYILYGASSGIGSASSTQTVASKAHATIVPPSGSLGHFGYSVATGDLDNDGEYDLVVGAWKEGVGSIGKAGSAWAVHGPLTGNITLDATTDAHATGSSVNAFSGVSVASGQDLNDDGHDDILVGAYNAEDGSGTETGAAYVLFGRGN
jgi:hypothetical protein